MCRSIKTLRTEELVTDEDTRAAALQYVRKISGYRKPSRANEAAFEAAVACTTITNALPFAVAAEPSLAEAHYNLGDTFLLQGAYADAITAFQQAVRFNPRMANAYCNLGAAYESTHQPLLSRRAYQAALACDPTLAARNRAAATARRTDQLTPSFFCSEDDDVVYWNSSRLPG